MQSLQEQINQLKHDMEVGFTEHDKNSLEDLGAAKDQIFQRIAAIEQYIGMSAKEDEIESAPTSSSNGEVTANNNGWFMISMKPYPSYKKGKTRYWSTDEDGWVNTEQKASAFNNSYFADTIINRIKKVKNYAKPQVEQFA